MAEKKYYWLKLKQDFFKRHDIRIIASMKNGTEYVLFYMKMMLESINHDGRLRFSDTIPYNEEMLSVITETNIDIVRMAIKVFEELNMIEIFDDGTYYMHEVERIIGSCVDNDAANRQRRFREKKKQMALPESNASCNGSVTENNESKSKEIHIDTDIETEEEKEVNAPTSEHLPPCPVLKIMESYNSICTSYSRIVSVEGNRRKAVLARWKSYPCIDIFIEVFQIAEASSFMKGNNNRNWIADFDWMMNANNFAKIREHKYDDSTSTRKKPTSALGVLQNMYEEANIIDETGNY